MLLSSNGALWKSCQLFISHDQITGIANKPPARLETTPARAGGFMQMPGKITLFIFYSVIYFSWSLLSSVCRAATGPLPSASSNLRRRTGVKQIYGVNMSGVTKGKQNKGTKVTRMKGHGVPAAAKGGGGTPASVVNESDQSLLFNKDTETLKCCFMWSGSGFRARW